MKKYLLSTMVCLMLFSVSAGVLPAYAQSGSSTCQVTAEAGETVPPSEPGDGEDESRVPEETDPGREPSEDAPPGEEQEEPSEEPEKLGDGDEGKPDEEKEPPESGGSESVPDPGEGETPQGQDEPEPEPSQSEEPLQPEPDREADEDRGLLKRFIAALLFLIILAALVAVGAFSYIWMWLLFIFFRKSRRQFHGILTEERNFFIRVRGVQDGSRLVQEIIDNAGSLAECRDGVMGEAAVTEIPRQSRMQVSYSGRRRCRETEADERTLFRILGKLEGAGDVKVRITCRGTGIDISLRFHV